VLEADLLFEAGILLGVPFEAGILLGVLS